MNEQVIQVPKLSIKIPKGDDGTLATLGAMAAVANYARHKEVFIQQAPPKSRKGHFRAADEVFRRTKNAYTFKADPGFELLRGDVFGNLKSFYSENQKPWRGDCDDRATVSAALLLLMGVMPCFIVMRERADGPYAHVCAGAVIRGWIVHPRIYPIDSQECDVPGTLPKHAGAAYMTLSSLGVWP